MQKPNTVFLTGASGYIGGSVAESLVRSGVRVRGLVREQAKADRLSTMGIDPVIGDLENLDLLTREAEKADAVINTASADHLPSVQALIKGLAGSSKCLIHTSGASIVGDDARGEFCTKNIFDENTPLVVQPLKQARRDIDLIVLGAAKAGIRSVVVCPSLIYGIGRGLNKHSVQIPFLIANARQHGAVQVVGPGLNVWSNVHIDDVVSMYCLALVKAPAGAFYFAANGEASFLDLGNALSQRLGLMLVEELDPEMAARQWGVPRAFYSLGSNSRVRSVMGRSELGWAPEHESVVNWILNSMPIEELLT